MQQCRTLSACVKKKALTWRVIKCLHLSDTGTMARAKKEPSEPVTVRVPTALRDDLWLLAQKDKRSEESDYWRKVLSDHVDEMRRAGKLPALNGAPQVSGLDVHVAIAGAGGGR